jgi:mannosyltransferase
VRWLQEAPRGLLLFGLAGAAAGLLHWYAVTVPAAFVVAAVLLRGRRALPVLGVGALAALPTAALVGLNLLNGNGASNAAHVLSTRGQLPRLALEVWAGGELPLVLLVLVLGVVGAARAEGVRVLAACWALVPLVLLTVGDLVRPLYWPRYLLAGLLGVGVLAAAGAWALPRLLRLPVAALLVALTFTATLPMLDRGPREQGDDLVVWLAGVQSPGEPVVAADTRSALSVDHFSRTLAPRLRPDLVLPPDDAPSDADRVWLVRREHRGGLWGTDDDDLLLAAGLAPERSWTFPGSKTVLVVQLWSR